ncbi:hypothetical protein DPMN_096593 [Dreissena polymorpha]|uniref:Uncharacterized protein n=1 Tax=Dreissena polymorpha TaxID=45954 RepID=A0A9D4R3X6_DREPO|nr:hypothetical protein DPMN_096593 [Dreissena polymorpha]
MLITTLYRSEHETNEATAVSSLDDHEIPCAFFERILRKTIMIPARKTKMAMLTANNIHAATGSTQSAKRFLQIASSRKIRRNGIEIGDHVICLRISYDFVKTLTNSPRLLAI